MTSATPASATAPPASVLRPGSSPSQAQPTRTAIGGMAYSVAAATETSMCWSAYAQVTKPIADAPRASSATAALDSSGAWAIALGSPGASGSVISAPSVIAQVVSSSEP